jgi:hypothetical protein
LPREDRVDAPEQHRQDRKRGLRQAPTGLLLLVRRDTGSAPSGCASSRNAPTTTAALRSYLLRAFAGAAAGVRRCDAIVC